MATVLGRLTGVRERTVDRRSTRLLSAALVLVGVFFMGVGTSWDINWHARVGRDSFWIPPHLVLYGGTLLALGGVLFGLAAEWMGSGRSMHAFRPPRGMVVTTAGALWLLASGPFDDLWHRLYGLDVTIWSPPHISLIAAAWTMVFGTLLVVLGERSRAEDRGVERSAPGRLVELPLLVICLTFMLQPIALVALPGVRYSYAQPGPLGIWLFPIIMAAMLPAVLFMAPGVLRRPAGVAVLALLMLALRQVGVEFAELGYALVFPDGIPVGGTIIGISGEGVTVAQTLIPLLVLVPAIAADLALLLTRPVLGVRAWIAASTLFGVSMAIEGALVPTFFAQPAAPLGSTLIAIVVLAAIALPGAWLGVRLGQAVSSTSRSGERELVTRLAGAGSRGRG